MSISALKLRPRLATVLILGGGALGGWTIRSRLQASSQGSPYLDPKDFSKLALSQKDATSSTSSIFKLLPTNAKPGLTSASIEPARAIWSIQLKQPQLQIGRSYTPLPTRCITPEEQSHEDTASSAARDEGMHLLIRREAGGEVSGYLHKLPLGSEIEVRGPHIEYAIPTNVKKILFLAGGTGIAPALQTAAALAKEPDSRVHILWASRKREDCVGLPSPKAEIEVASRWTLFRKVPLQVEEQAGSELRDPVVKQLLEFQARTKGRVTVECFVDEERQFITPEYVARALKGFKGAGVDDGEGQVLLSGPDGFIGYWAGRKEWQNGRELQGSLGGVLAKLPLNGFTVWKL